MCIAMQKGTFTGTRIYVGEVSAEERSVIYECTARSEVANALIFTVPTKLELGDSNFVNLEDYPLLLKEMEDVIDPPELSRASGAKSPIGVVPTGEYTTVYSNEASIDMIRSIIYSPFVPEERRPELNYELIEDLNKIGLPLVIACYAPGKKRLHPFGLTYRAPIYADKLVAPMLDGHGALGAKTALRDHWIFAGSYRALNQGTVIEVGDQSAYPLLPTFREQGTVYTSIVGKRIQGMTLNGDLFVDLPTLVAKQEIDGYYALPR